MRALLILAFALPGLAWGHIRLKSPVPRTNEDGLKVAPCGGAVRTTTPTILTSGQTLQVSWEETINHPGYYTIEFSPGNDVGFEELALLMDQQNGAGIHQYSVPVTIPSVVCDACTLRLIQYMTEDPSNPRLYYSCADIKVGSASPTPGPGSSPGPGALDGNPISGKMPMAKMAGGCGLVAGSDNSGPPWNAAVILIPLILIFVLRRLTSAGVT
jgi:hypothetical protein